MGALNDSGDYENNPAFSDGQAGPGGLLGLLRQVSPQPQIQTGINSGAGLPGALLGGLAILGAHRLLQQHYAGSHADGTTPEPADPNFRQLSRRPPSQPAINGDQPVTSYSSGAGASPASSDIAAGGAAQYNPTANFTGESLAAKAPDPAKPKVSTILGGPSIVPQDNPPPDPDDDDDDCMRQKNKEISACYKRLKRNPKWDYVNECRDRAIVRWDMCNRTGQIPDKPPPWGEGMKVGSDLLPSIRGEGQIAAMSQAQVDQICTVRRRSATWRLTMFVFCSIGPLCPTGYGRAMSDKKKRQRRERLEAAFPIIDALEKQWLNRLRQGRSGNDIVDEIRQRFRKARGEERYCLAGTLVSFLILAKRETETVQVVDAMIDELPDDVHFPMKKAFLYHYILDDPENALPCIEMALERAYRSRRSRREALGVKARILLALGRGKELSDVLEEIMSMQMIKGDADIGRERDFVDRAPPGLISEDVLSRYNEFRPKRASDGTEDMPPEWEPPEWE